MLAASHMNWNAKCAAALAPPRAMGCDRCRSYPHWACCHRHPNSPGSLDKPRPPRQSKMGRNPRARNSPASAAGKIADPATIRKLSTRTSTSADTLLNVGLGTSLAQEDPADPLTYWRG